MKFLHTLLGIAMVFGLGLGAAQAGNLGGEEREFYHRAPGFHHNCFDNPRHPGCRPRHYDRPHYPRHGFYTQPGIHLDLRFGDVYRRHDYHPRPLIRKVRFCSNGMAVEKARSIGIRHIRAYGYRDHILIKGKKRGHRVEVAVSRQWGCPIIDY